MALTADQQKKVNELKDLAPYDGMTDDDLWNLIEETGSIDSAASRLWAKKAKSTASYFNIREGSSARNLGEIHKNALAMAALFEEKAAADTTQRGPTTRAIRRPSW